ncbi:hypothetical protein [Candidatus Pelagibacter sp.]|uniref:hypothetical protein n=1 Tax=Candidatus Pelagibacter sp. TaxID=2024849 RepID=UPI003F82C2EF
MSKISEKKIKYYLKVIDQIENTRKKNNFNWMNILRIALKNSPEETLKVMGKINNADSKILKLNKKFRK